MNQHALNFLWVSGNGSRHRLNLLTKHSVWFSWSTGPFSTDDPTVGVVVLRNPFFTLVPFRLINTEKVSLSCGVSVELLTCILWGFLIVPCPVACLGKVDDRSASGGRMGCVSSACFCPFTFYATVLCAVHSARQCGLHGPRVPSCLLQGRSRQAK